MFQSPMYDFGYDISDFYAVHDEYGTMEDFDNLVNTANELGKQINIYTHIEKDLQLDTKRINENGLNYKFKS